MNVTVENLAPCKKLVRIELEPQSVDSAFESTTRDFQRQVSLPGFRQGKAPRDMVVRKYETQIQEEVKKKLIGDAYRKAVTDQKLTVVTFPDIEEIQFGRGQALQFAATIETAPDFELPEYKGLAAQRETKSVTDEDVERALTILRDRQAAYNTVGRAAQEGDVTVVNYVGTSEGKPLTEFSPTSRGLTEQKNFWINIDKTSFIPGFADQLVGASAGDHRTVNVDFAQDFVAPQLAGKKGTYEVDIVEVKERKVPELSDELAKSYGAESLEKLREGVRADLERELDSKKGAHVRNQVAQALLNLIKCDLPETLVAQETRNVVYNLVNENQKRGVEKEKIDEKKEEIFNAANATARERVKAGFVFGRIAEKEGIKVEQSDWANRIYRMAQAYKMPADKLVKELQKNEMMGAVQQEILHEKVISFLAENARIEDVAPANETPAAI